MSQYLPYGRFKWLKNINKLGVNSISEKSPIGYVLEVDLEYPDELHKLHDESPLAPEKLAIAYDMLSDYYKEIADEYGIKVDNVKKLIPNLGDKTKYAVHYRNLQLYLSLRKKLTKIYKVLTSKQSDWMKILIINTEKRRKATNKFEKDFFKLMINSIYEYVYMRPKVNSNRFEISNRFEKSIRLHGDFTAAACK